MKSKIKEYDKKQIRMAWDEDNEEWLFSIIDVIFVLVDSKDFQSARNYWKVLKKRLKDEGNETVTNCNQLKMKASDGKLRLTDVATMEQLFSNKFILLNIIYIIDIYFYFLYRIVIFGKI